MPTVDPVVLQLEADVKSYDAQVGNATRLSETSFQKIETSASKAEKAIVVASANAGREMTGTGRVSLVMAQQFAQMTQQAISGGDVLNAMAIQLPDLAVALSAAGDETGSLATLFGGPWGSALAAATSVALALAPAIHEIGDAAADASQTLAALRAEGAREADKQEAIARLRAQFPVLAASTARADRDRLAILTGIATATIDEAHNRAAAMAAANDQTTAEQTIADNRLRAAAELARLQERQIWSLAGLYEDAFRGGTAAIWKDFKSIGLRVIAETLARFTVARLSGQKGGIGDFLGTAVSSVLGLKSIPGFAAGTDNAPRGLAWVGERGRELVNFNGGEQVIPLHKLGSGGGGGPSIINITVDARDAVLTQTVRQWVAEGVQQATVLGSQLGSADARGRIARQGRNRLPG